MCSGGTVAGPDQLLVAGDRSGAGIPSRSQLTVQNRRARSWSWLCGLTLVASARFLVVAARLPLGARLRLGPPDELVGSALRAGDEATSQRVGVDELHSEAGGVGGETGGHEAGVEVRNAQVLGVEAVVPGPGEQDVGELGVAVGLVRRVPPGVVQAKASNQVATDVHGLRSRPGSIMVAGLRMRSGGGQAAGELDEKVRVGTAGGAGVARRSEIKPSTAPPESLEPSTSTGTVSLTSPALQQ